MKQLINTRELVTAYSKADNRLLLLDYDGTLVPFDDHADETVPSVQVMETLEKLGANHRNRVVLISGRGQKYLEKYFSKLPITLVAEHGAYAKNPGEGWVWLFPPDISKDWMPVALKALCALVYEYDGSYLEQKTLSIAWHYRGLRKQLSLEEKNQVINAIWFIRGNADFDILDSEETIELRASGINKGLYLRQWKDGLPFNFVLAIGDSETDEDLFKELGKYHFSVKVGYSDRTKANYSIKTQEEVLPLLDELASHGMGATDHTKTTTIHLPQPITN